MSVSRVFRKYSRTLLLVFMSALLIVFLVGDVIGRAANSQGDRDFEIGTGFNEPVYYSQTKLAEDDFELATQLGIPAPRFLDADADRNLCMYLLLEEARRAGVSISGEQIRAELERMPGASQLLAMIRARTHRSLNSIYESAARATSVFTLASQQMRVAAGASLPELEHTYRDQNQTAKVKISVVNANGLLKHVGDISEEDLLAEFEKGKDRDNGHTEEELIYGYRVPDRVQVEYMTVDPEDLLPTIRVSRRAAERYYEEHASKYVRKVENESAFVLEPGQPQTEQMTFEEAEGQVKEDLRKDLAISQAQSFVNRLEDEIRRPWLATEVDEDNRHEIPPDDQIVSFEELRDKYASECPVQYVKTELATRVELRKANPEFMASMATIQNAPVRAGQLIFGVEGLVDPESESAKEALRLEEPGMVVINQKDPAQAFVFRVIAVAAAGPPDSLDDVRDKVEENTKREKAFEMAKEQAEALAENARVVGLDQAVAEDEALKALLASANADDASEDAASEPQENTFQKELQPTAPERPFTRRSTYIPNVGFSPGLHKKVFELAAEADTDAAHRVVVVPMARSLKWAVVELLSVEPIYQNEFDLQRADLLRNTTSMQTQAFLSEWFDPENIKARAGWVPKTTAE